MPSTDITRDWYLKGGDKRQTSKYYLMNKHLEKYRKYRQRGGGVTTDRLCLGSVLV